MTRIAILALSKWAHFSWLPRGERALTEWAQVDANADLLARYPQLTAMQTTPAMPPFAVLPRPACAKVLRVTAALAHARLLRRVISARAQRIFEIRIAPHLLHAIQRDLRGEQVDVDQNVTLNVLDRAEMTAAGLRVALRTIEDPALRVLVELRLPRAVVRGMADVGVCDMRVETARDLLDAAYALARGEAC
ncbi:hypothetical protein [Paraburkholderia dinghuensis]|uniref:Uncharacterized protein n=1 Tax=Paraburkholderia dinghuensis TaxID=2305225 RepID=A0A3N6P5J6_9BURK|nr:hypothetical protein [Paraburkholderia dinghuensis]RQH09093.1 hypothetical protein D1Y85_04315 [Paraburkholderia dinghuensis]